MPMSEQYSTLRPHPASSSRSDQQALSRSDIDVLAYVGLTGHMPRMEYCLKDVVLTKKHISYTGE